VHLVGFYYKNQNALHWHVLLIPPNLPHLI